MAIKRTTRRKKPHARIQTPFSVWLPDEVGPIVKNQESIASNAQKMREYAILNRYDEAWRGISDEEDSKEESHP